MAVIESRTTQCRTERMPVSLHPGCVQDNIGTWSPTCLSKGSVTVGAIWAISNLPVRTNIDYVCIGCHHGWITNVYMTLIFHGLEVGSMSTDKSTIRTNLGDLRNTHITARTVVVKTPDKSEVPHVMIMVNHGQQMSAGGQSSMGPES